MDDIRDCTRRQIELDSLSHADIRRHLKENSFRDFSDAQALKAIELLQKGRFDSAEALAQYMVLVGASHRPDARKRPIPETR